jgi:hypothetical protein
MAFSEALDIASGCGYDPVSRLDRTGHSVSDTPVDCVHRLRGITELVVSVSPIVEKCFR